MVADLSAGLGKRVLYLDAGSPSGDWRARTDMVQLPSGGRFKSLSTRREARGID